MTSRRRPLLPAIVAEMADWLDGQLPLNRGVEFNRLTEQFNDELMRALDQNTNVYSAFTRLESVLLEAHQTSAGVVINDGRVTLHSTDDDRAARDRYQRHVVTSRQSEPAAGFGPDNIVVVALTSEDTVGFRNYAAALRGSVPFVVVPASIGLATSVVGLGMDRLNRTYLSSEPIATSRLLDSTIADGARLLTVVRATVRSAVGVFGPYWMNSTAAFLDVLDRSVTQPAVRNTLAGRVVQVEAVLGLELYRDQPSAGAGTTICGGAAARIADRYVLAPTETLTLRVDTRIDPETGNQVINSHVDTVWLRSTPRSTDGGADTASVVSLFTLTGAQFRHLCLQDYSPHVPLAVVTVGHDTELRAADDDDDDDEATTNVIVRIDVLTPALDELKSVRFAGADLRSWAEEKQRSVGGGSSSPPPSSASVPATVESR